MSWENLEEAFKELDKREFQFFAGALGSYRRALMNDGGFTRKEAMRLVESYSRFIYDMSLEEFLAEKRLEDLEEFEEEVDDDDEEAV